MACFHGYGNLQDNCCTTLAMMNNMRFVCPSVCMCICLSICASVCLSVHLSVSLSANLNEYEYLNEY